MIEADALSIGEKVGGKFVVVRLLGSGGMGAVYEARDEVLDRAVALKVIFGSASDADVERFEREARAVARVTSPHVVQVFEASVWNGARYIVLELLDGVTLDRAPIDDASTLQYVAEALDGIAVAHEAGIAHRDLKPQNIMIARSRNRSVAKVLDFGISKILEESPEGSTVNAVAMGTARYMSPEQVLRRPVGRKSDIFSLAVILFERLTGTPPFEGTDRAHMKAVVQDAPRRLRELRPDLPLSLERILHRALGKDPDHRPSADELRKVVLEAHASLQNMHAEGASQAPSSAPSSEPTAELVVVRSPRFNRRTTTVALAVALGLVIVAAAGWPRAKGVDAAPPSAALRPITVSTVSTVSTARPPIHPSIEPTPSTQRPADPSPVSAPQVKSSASHAPSPAPTSTARYPWFL